MPDLFLWDVEKKEAHVIYLSDHDAYCEAPCSHACPTHIDIPAYMALGWEWDPHEAPLHAPHGCYRVVMTWTGEGDPKEPNGDPKEPVKPCP